MYPFMFPLGISAREDPRALHATFKNYLSRYNLGKSENVETQKFFKRIENIKYESGVMKINLAVSRLPNFLADPNVHHDKTMPHHQCTIAIL